jgi:large conductance mechanosensitive channel
MLNKIKGLATEFMGFAFKGNMLDMAVGIVIGGAFSSLVKAMVEDIVMPAITLVTSHTGKAPVAYQDWAPGGIHVGTFLGELLNFVILAAAVFFMIVKVIGWLSKLLQKPAPTVAPEVTTKECPMCLSVIPLKARKCAHCTSDLPVTA